MKNENELRILLNRNIKMDRVEYRRSSFNYGQKEIYGINSKGERELYGDVYEAIEILKKKREGGIFTINQIISSARGERAKIYGFYWQFKDAHDQLTMSLFHSEEKKNAFLVRKNILDKKVIMFNIDGTPLEVFDDVIESVKYFYNKENGSYHYPDVNSILSLMDKNKKTSSKTCFNHQWDWYDNHI